MSTAGFTTEPVITPTDDGADDLWHLYCCDENLALCGTDVTTVPVTDGLDEPHCVVCEDLSGSPCRVCGADQ